MAAIYGKKNQIFYMAAILHFLVLYHLMTFFSLPHNKGIIINPYTDIFVTILAHSKGRVFFWSLMFGGHLEFAYDLDLEYKNMLSSFMGTTEYLK